MPLEPGAELALIELIEVPPLSRELIPTELFEGVALDEDVSMLERLERERERESHHRSGLHAYDPDRHGVLSSYQHW